MACPDYGKRIESADDPEHSDGITEIEANDNGSVTLFETTICVSARDPKAARHVPILDSDPLRVARGDDVRDTTT